MDPFLGQIEAFPYPYAPRGWMFCAGQILPINQYQALFALLGVTYGGNGTSNFALPDLRGRIPLSSGQGPGLSIYNLGQPGGAETHTLTMSEMPAGAHNHAITAVNNGTTGGTNVPSAGVTLGAGYSGQAGSPVVSIYSTDAPTVAMRPLGNTGGQAHENRMPYLAVNYCIAISGIFPSRN